MTGAVEHITLDGEADLDTVAAEPAHRTTLRRYIIPGDAPGSSTELSILEGHYLGVSIVEPRGKTREFQFDLRFASPHPLRVLRLPWIWLIVTTGLGASGLISLLRAWPAIISALGPGLTAGLCAGIIGAIAIYVCLRWTTESLQLRSQHGGATLVGVPGPLGGTRRHRPVFSEISKCVLAARLARPQEKPQFLRDEMREHYRLRQQGVLSERQYEASKAAILAAH